MTQLIERQHDQASAVVVDSPEGTGSRAWWLLIAALGTIGLAVISLILWPTPGPDRLLLSVGSQTVTLLDPTEETTLYQLDNAVASPDASRIYQTREQGGTTELREIDTTTGDVVTTQSVAGPQHIRVVSPTGELVALMEDQVPTTGIYEPQSRPETTITVARDDGSEARAYELDGNYEPETFSLDGDTLFLIEFWPPLKPDRYFVRHLDLTNGEILDKYTPEVELDPEMRGKARGQVISPDGAFLYTLYTLEPGSDPVHDPDVEVDSERYAFIHVLDLRVEISVCIFLPEPFGTGNEAAVGLGISPDGSRVFVVDTSTASVATVDTANYAVERIDTLDSVGPGETTSRPAVAVVDRDTFFMTNYGGWSIVQVEVNEEGASKVDAYIGGEPAASLDLSPDGRHLRIAFDDHVSILDIGSGQEIATLDVPSDGGPINFVGTPSGDIGRIPVECAC